MNCSVWIEGTRGGDHDDPQKTADCKTELDNETDFVCGTDYSNTDFNKDGTVNILDLGILNVNWGQTVP